MLPSFFVYKIRKWEENILLHESGTIILVFGMQVRDILW
ncbi:hypothetical protein SGPB_1821 [Streptococcus pasteurianus ATCC 43144]|uniref:Uncharacterized protein n=1 Tax=Streptococcus pasteurianus (strain ATCC 43144 / JCM 5346 / CCUG 46074 / CDC 1723-81) TaxID=981540 RepID=F5X3G9_STRPX|nr:hypothetical protein SGPB_1821 [Streptococcus pasteurianus ATCC 43144]